MDSKRWRKHLAAIISLQNRAQNIIQSLNFSRLLTKSLSPSLAAEKLLRAEEAQHLLRQAERSALLLKEWEVSEGEARSLHSIIAGVHTSLNRTNAIINVLKKCNAHWGLNDPEKESFPSSEAESGERATSPISAVAKMVRLTNRFEC